MDTGRPATTVERRGREKPGLMCTVVVSINPGRNWPLLLAANRDEMLARPWDLPAEHWPNRPGVVAGRDRSGGGTWLGVNGAGVIAAVLNRVGSLGPAPGKRSRGELPLFALEAGTAAKAATRISQLDAGAYRTFNMVIADRGGAIVLRGTEAGRPERLDLAPGLHMVTARDPDDLASPRIARHLPRLRGQPLPSPPDWSGWAEILADQSGPPAAQINVVPRGGFGTVCASLLAIDDTGRITWQFAPGPPGATPFAPVALAS
jgi:hypothetical protein